MLAHDERIVARREAQMAQQPLLRLFAHALPPRGAEHHLELPGHMLHEGTDVPSRQVVEGVAVEGLPVDRVGLEQPTAPKPHFGQRPVDVDNHDSSLRISFHTAVRLPVVVLVSPPVEGVRHAIELSPAGFASIQANGPPNPDTRAASESFEFDGHGLLRPTEFPPYFEVGQSAPSQVKQLPDLLLAPRLAITLESHGSSVLSETHPPPQHAAHGCPPPRPIVTAVLTEDLLRCQFIDLNLGPANGPSLNHRHGFMVLVIASTVGAHKSA